MQAVILAAGFGKRLKPITDTMPKCLVPLHEKPMLIHTLQLLESRGIENVVIVVGHMKEMVYHTIGHRFGKINISYVENDLYDKTNNVYSLWLARDRLDTDSLLLECDLYYKSDLIDTLIQCPRDCNMLVSKYDSSCMDGTVVEIDQQDVVKRLIVKNDQNENFDFSNMYKTVNMYYFNKLFLEKYFVPYLDLYIHAHGVNSYYELVLGVLIYLSHPKIHAVIVDSNKWREIDDVHDLRNAEKHFFSQNIC